MKKDNFITDLNKLEKIYDEAADNLENCNKTFDTLLNNRLKLILSKCFKLNKTFEVYCSFLYDNKKYYTNNSISLLKELANSNDVLRFSCNQKLKELRFPVDDDIECIEDCVDLSQWIPAALLLSDNWEEELDRGLNFAKQFIPEKNLKQQALNKLTSAERKALGL